MSNFTFACASVNGLTLAQKRETVTALRASIKAEIAARKIAKRSDKDAKIAARAVRVAARELKMADKIAKAEARLIALQAKNDARLQKLADLKAKPVGVKAVRANRKPSKVVITEMA
jgi:hypothetical protein